VTCEDAWQSVALCEPAAVVLVPSCPLAGGIMRYGLAVCAMCRTLAWLGQCRMSAARPAVPAILDMTDWL
jgi:hypothetical protein